MKKKSFKNIITFLLTTMMIIGCLSLTPDINVKAAGITNEGDYIDFAYTGGVQTFTAPYKGLYKLEVWGASGGRGNASQKSTAGKGGYSNGYIELEKGQTIYIVVGGQGTTTSNIRESGADSASANGGYNGGGSAWVNKKTSGSGQTNGSGGGATHIAKKTGLLSSLSSSKSDVLIVAGGGGGVGAPWYGDSDTYFTGGSGGGVQGGNSGYGANTCNEAELISAYGASGGSQIAGGSGCAAGVFGQGGSASTSSAVGSGGGGGWYGGGASYYYVGAGGGSGYIGGVPALTFQGNSYGPQTSLGVNSGHGKAKITYVKSAAKKEVKYLEYLDVPGHGAQLFERNYTEGTWVQWYVKCSVLYAPDDAVYTWYKDGVKLSDTGSNITATQTGLYKCVCKQGDITLLEDTYDVKIDRTIQKTGTGNLRFNGKKQTASADCIVLVDGSKKHWYKTDVTVSIINLVPDEESGIRGYRFSWKNTVKAPLTMHNDIMPTPAITFSEEGAYFINGYVVDNAGNDSGGSFTEYGDFKIAQESYLFFYIDKTAPTVNSFTYSTAPTNNLTLKVNATDNEGSGIKEYYYIHNGTESTHQTSPDFDITENGTYTFYCIDNLDWVSAGKDVTITNVDRLAPVIDNITNDYDESTKTAKLKIDYHDIAATLTDSSSGVGYISVTQSLTPSFESVSGVTSTTMTISSTGAYHICVKDKAGNISAIVDLDIDLTAPAISNITLSTTGWTNQDVEATVTATDNVGVTQYRLNDGAWQNSNVLAISENGTHSIYAKDKAGNISDAYTVTVSKIDKEDPVITVKEKRESPAEFYICHSYTDNRELDHYEWHYPSAFSTKKQIKGSSGEAGWWAASNGVFTFRIYDKAGNYAEAVYTVTCLDLDKPSVTGASYSVVTSGTKARIAFTGEDAPATADSVSSGIVAYCVTQSASPDSWKTGSGTSFSADVTATGKWYIYVKDAAGNVSDPYEISIDLVAPVVTSIVPSTTNWTNQDITLTVNATDDSGIEGYSIDGITYQTSNIFTVTGNNTYLISVKDIYGNVGKKSITVSNIDRNAPTVTASKVSESVTEVKYSLTFTDAEELSEVWIILNGIEIKYPLSGTSGSKEATLTDNGSYIVRVFDKAGNQSEISFTVTCIVKDYTLDEVANVFHFHFGTPNSTTANGCYTVPVTTTRTVVDEYKCGDWERDDAVDGAYCSGCGKFSYKCPGGYSHHEKIQKTETVTVYTCNRLAEPLGSMVLKKDISDVYKLKVEDSLVNASVVSYTWKGVDTVGAYPSLHPDGKAPSDVDSITAGEITVPDFGKYTCSVTYKDLISGGTYKVNFYYTVEDFDLEPPVIESILASTKEWTKEDITLTVNATDNFAVTGLTVSTRNNLTNDDIVGTQNVFTITENGNYYIYVRDAIGNFAKELFVVDIIDKEKPVISKIEQVYSENNEEKASDITENVSARFKTIRVTATDELSGLDAKAYRFKTKDGSWSEWQESNLLKGVYYNGTYAVEVKDKAGNIVSSEFTVAGMLETGLVIIEDVADDGNSLGSTSKEYPLFTTVAGSDLGADATLSKYYEGYYYSSCTSVVVGVGENRIKRSFMVARYNVTFHNSDGGIFANETVKYANAVSGVYVPTKPSIQTPTGYTSYIFSHWEDASGNRVDTSSIKSDLSLYPVYEEVETGFVQTVRFHLNDSADTVVTQFVERGYPADVPIPYKEYETIEGGIRSYEFKAWVNGSGDVVNDFSDIQEDGDYFATYTEEILMDVEEVIVEEFDALNEEAEILILASAEDEADDEFIIFAPPEMISDLETPTQGIINWIGENKETGSTMATVGLLTILASLITNGIFGTGLVQTGIFFSAYAFKSARYTSGAWCLKEGNVRYVDKWGREVTAVYNEKTKSYQFISKKGKELTGVNVDNALKDLRSMRITYPEFNQLLKESEVYTVFDKNVKLEVVNAKGNQVAKGIRFTRNLKNLIGDAEIKLVNGANEIMYELNI